MGVAIVANCNVQYIGRASSTLEDGDYLIILKDDRSIQIQGQKLNKPLNYINFKTLEISDNKMVAKSKNEQIIININREISRIQLDLSDNKPKLVNSEEDLVNKLKDNLHLVTSDTIIRATKEYRTKYGNIDLFVETSNGNYIIEVKRHRININSCKQIQKYLECEKGVGILCAPKIIKSAEDYCISNCLRYLSLNF
ncbi:endonuclease [Azospirillaceae bacterium]